MRELGYTLWCVKMKMKIKKKMKREDMCDGNLLYPDWPRYWRPMSRDRRTKEDWEGTEIVTHMCTWGKSGRGEDSEKDQVCHQGSLGGVE